MIRLPSVSRLVLLLIALLLLPHPASAACPTCYAWKPLRIGAGGWLTGLDIAPDGTKVVRADTYGAFLWNAAAGEWQQLVTSASIPVEDHFLNYDQIEGAWEIRIAPSDSRRLYMVWQGYLYRSTDRGAHWVKTPFTRRLSLDPNDGNRTSGQKMAVDPANPDVVYVGTDSNGVWRTLDGGASWSQVSAITAGASPGHPGIVFDRASGTDASGRTKTIYVPSYGNGVWRSLDAGATWTKTSGGPTNVWHAQIASDGIYYCATQGAVWKYAAGAWTRLEQSGPDWEVVVTDPANPARLIIADSGARVQMSLDRGATWNQNYWVASGRTATDVPWLAWTKEDYLSNGDMRIDPTDGKLYFAEGIGVWQTAFPAVAEQPFTWSSQSKGIEQLVANWIWSVPGGSLFVTAWDRPVFRSTNPDVFPTTHGPNRTNSITYGASVEHAVNNSSFLAVDAGWQSEESSYSTDAGVTWTKFASYPPSGSPGLGHIAVSTDQNMVWIPDANKKGYYTKNRGASWTALPSPVNVAFDWSMYNNRHVITADRVTPNKFYLYDSNSGLYVSTTGGDSWTRVFTGHIVNSADGFNLKIKAVPGKAGHLFYTNGSYGGGDHVGPDWRNYQALDRRRRHVDDRPRRPRGLRLRLRQGGAGGELPHGVHRRIRQQRLGHLAVGRPGPDVGAGRRASARQPGRRQGRRRRQEHLRHRVRRLHGLRLRLRRHRQHLVAPDARGHEGRHRCRHRHVLACGHQLRVHLQLDVQLGHSRHAVGRSRRRLVVRGLERRVQRHRPCARHLGRRPIGLRRLHFPSPSRLPWSRPATARDGRQPAGRHQLRPHLHCRLGGVVTLTAVARDRRLLRRLERRLHRHRNLRARR